MRPWTAFWFCIAVSICGISGSAAYVAVHAPPKDQDCSKHGGVKTWQGAGVERGQNWLQGDTVSYWPTTCKDGYTL